MCMPCGMSWEEEGLSWATLFHLVELISQPEMKKLAKSTDDSNVIHIVFSLYKCKKMHKLHLLTNTEYRKNHNMMQKWCTWTVLVIPAISDCVYFKFSRGSNEQMCVSVCVSFRSRGRSSECRSGSAQQHCHRGNVGPGRQRDREGTSDGLQGTATLCHKNIFTCFKELSWLRSLKALTEVQR